MLAWLWHQGYGWPHDILTFALATQRVDVADWLINHAGAPSFEFEVVMAILVFKPAPRAVQWFLTTIQGAEVEELDSWCRCVLYDNRDGRSLMAEYPEKKAGHIEVLQCLWRHGATVGQERAARCLVEQVVERVEAVQCFMHSVFENVRGAAASDCIKRKWNEAMADPSYLLCRKRLLQEFRSMSS